MDAKFPVNSIVDFGQGDARYTRPTCHPRPSAPTERRRPGIQRKTRRRRNSEPSAILTLDPQTVSQARPFEDDEEIDDPPRVAAGLRNASRANKQLYCCACMGGSRSSMNT